MSRTSLHRPRPPRAVRDRPAAGTRLRPTPIPASPIPWGGAFRSPCRRSATAGAESKHVLSPVEGGLKSGMGGVSSSVLPISTPTTSAAPGPNASASGSDQSSSRPLHGRSPDKSRHALLQGSRLRISAPVEGHTYVADLVLAGESQQSDERRLKTNAPFKDSTVVTTGVFRLRTPVSGPRSHPLGWSSTSGGRDCPTPRISRLSSTSSQKSGARIPPSSQPDYFRLRTPVSGPRSHPLGWSSTSGGRDCPTPRISRVSFTSPQKLGAVAEPSPM